MGSQRFRAVIAAGPSDSGVITMPFDPDEAWGAKADHPVGDTIDGWRIRARLLLAGSGWVLTLAPKRLRGMGVAIGDDVTVELAPEGPQRGDLADDVAAALAANPAAGAFFDTLAQFYRKAYLRWIDATSRRPNASGSAGQRSARTLRKASRMSAAVEKRSTLAGAHALMRNSARPGLRSKRIVLGSVTGTSTMGLAFGNGWWPLQRSR